ncbi:hypothetical protein VNO77_07877 [Canavalia gladiata]|uniref:Uncharacterized protein n=1 Tax=Canavalia gladiata TaxID=3824 RepID=A0AAN9M8S1_CANGL
MIALKAIHASFGPANSAYTLYPTKLPNTINSILCFCKSNDSDSEDPKPEGDAHNQELLAQMAMLQTQKVRLTDFLDERSAYLTQFVEEANAEFDKIGEDARKGLDEASARITANMESQMLEFEESIELNKQEIQESENKVVEFEDQIEKEQNEGLFFQNLGKKAPVDKAIVKEEAEKVKDVVSKENDGSKSRELVYLFFIGLVSFGIVDSITSSSGADWKKAAVLGAIFVALFSLFTNEQSKDNNKD